jgi:hypothetical protein
MHLFNELLIIQAWFWVCVVINKDQCIWLLLAIGHGRLPTANW